MASDNNSRRYSDDARYDQRPRSAQSRPAGSRPGSARPSGNRTTGNRPTNNGRRPVKKTRRANPRFFAFIAILVVLVIALIIFVPKLFKGGDPITNPQTTTQPSEIGSGTVTETPTPEDPVSISADTSHDAIAELLGQEDSNLQGLSAEDMVKIDDLSINPSLPEEWMNILLLGTDERNLAESARTDSMIICSINKQTGQIKLTSIMRDLAVDFDNIGKYNGTYRINSAFFFGGANLAMQTVNECFNMNIQKYVCINLFGFQEVAHALGGIDIDITESEMNQINKLMHDLWREAQRYGVDDSGMPTTILETFGPNTHLDGRMTLAYARIRKIDSDYARAERQRKVLNALLTKVKQLNAIELSMLGTSMFQYFSTNMSLDEILAIAITVTGNGDMSNIESFRLPMNQTYKQERRNEQDMFYDCDWNTNAIGLYNFIYEG